MAEMSIGQLVIAKAGRTSNEKFIVICIINEQYVYISDGKIHKIEKPKKKNIKHLMKTGYISEEIKNKIEANKKIYNCEVKSFLKSIDLYREQEV